MATTGIVTDSTASLPQAALDYWGIKVVPVSVVVHETSYEEGVEINAEQVAEAMRRKLPVTTSRPAPFKFERVYQQLAEQGYTSIVSAHLSAELSGTYDSARVAAERVGIEVIPVDSRSISMGLGYGCLEGARAAANGLGAAEVAEVVTAAAARSRVLFYVNSLEYLRRGGRIGAAQRWIGGALAVKPILQLARGRVQPLEKVRTAAKGMARLAELAVDYAEDRPCTISVMHLDAAQRAETLAAELATALPEANVNIGGLGAVIGCHVGPGTLAAIVSPAE